MLNRLIRIGNSIGAKFFVLLVSLLILAFGIVIYVNIYFLNALFREDAVSNAIQVSNVIKRATYNSMLGNHREDLTNTILSIGQEPIFEGIRIYNKLGEIAFSDKLEELGRVVDKKAEQCHVCHLEEPVKGVVPTEDRTRTLTSPLGYRVLGLINPIENAPECFNASCHAHSPKEKLLGLLDVKISLEEGDRKILATRNKMILYSAILILLTTIVKGFFIHRMIHKPIKKLSDATREVANLNLDHKVDIRSRDELGNLALSFNKMTGQVKEKTIALEKTQSRLILAEKMASMGELSAMVAHEINNPLSGILSYAKVSSRYLNRENVDTGTLEAVRQNLNFIGEESKRCGNIVKSLLAFARKGSGEFRAEHLNLIVENSVRVIDHSVEMKELLLVRELDSGDDVVECDAGGIQQVLVALFVNAIEASGRGGRISVRTDCTSDRDRVRIVVADEGSGIADDVLPHIFEPLFSTKAKNTGLGLSLVHGIVEQHAGTIEVATRAGEGTAFTIRLPRVTPQKERPDRLMLSRLIS